VHVVGGRSDLIRVAPVARALQRHDTFRQVLVHASGDHEQRAVVAELRADLNGTLRERQIPAARVEDGPAQQAARALVAFDGVLAEEGASLVVLGGSGNIALACALAASRRGIALAHLAAGFRSGDWSDVEEIDRTVCDRLCDTLFVHGPAEGDNLVVEGVPDSRIDVAGNTAIDMLRRTERRARSLAAWSGLGVAPGDYVLATLHRPANVDDPDRRNQLLVALGKLARRRSVVVCLHEQTRRRVSSDGGLARLRAAGAICTPPLEYAEFLSLELGAGAIVTDSGGVQDEASALGIDCYVLASAPTRRTVLTGGTAVLIGDDLDEIPAIRPSYRRSTAPEIPLWDGEAAERVATSLVTNYVFAPALSALG
jgi:UDP-N-acetylglucosamine 2-epimerase (non-hydrolysing)